MCPSTEEEESVTRRHYRCLICGAARCKRSLMLSHMQKSHPLSPSDFSIVGRDLRVYRCFVCGESRSRLSYLQKHMQDVHSGPLQVLFEKKRERKVEENTMHRHYCCLICGAARSKRSLILSHMQESHPLSPSEFSVVGKDRRVYRCLICGDSRSKPSLLQKHMQVAHSGPLQTYDSSVTGDSCPSVPENRKRKGFECEECGRVAKKPSLLQQHSFAHTVQRPYVCPRDGCGKCYKRPDHLKRHLIQHEEKACLCPQPGCIMVCSNQYNLIRHLRKHDVKGDVQRGSVDSKNVLKCPEPGCNTVFQYPCRLQSHCDTVHGLPHTDIRCGVPGCSKSFANANLLLEHIRHFHNTVVCQICGVSVSRKYLKRHVDGHDTCQAKQRLFCPFDGCIHSFSNSSNLSVHVRVCHLGRKEYCCTYDGCGKAFGYRHTRDTHERTSFHSYVQGDFEEEDLKFQARCRGGRKPATLQKVEDLFRRRVVCPIEEQEGAQENV